MGCSDCHPFNTAAPSLASASHISSRSYYVFHGRICEPFLPSPTHLALHPPFSFSTFNISVVVHISCPHLYPQFLGAPALYFLWAARTALSSRLTFQLLALTGSATSSSLFSIPLFTPGAHLQPSTEISYLLVSYVVFLFFSPVYELVLGLFSPMHQLCLVALCCVSFIPGLSPSPPADPHPQRSHCSYLAFFISLTMFPHHASSTASL